MFVKACLIVAGVLVALALAGRLWPSDVPDSRRSSGITISGPSPTEVYTPSDVHAAVRGVVRSWDAEEAVGVIDAAEAPGGCWVGLGMTKGESDLVPGQRVEFTFEDLGSPLQDGYRYRAVVVTPLD